MAQRLKRTFILLAAYENFTRKESVSLNDGNLERLLEIQGKKAKVIVELGALEEALDASERLEFERRVSLLQRQEEENGNRLAAKLSENRQEFRELAQNAVSASKLRNAYSRNLDRSTSNASLRGKA